MELKVLNSLLIPSAEINCTKAIYHGRFFLTYKNMLREIANQIPFVQFNLGLGISHLTRISGPSEHSLTGKSLPQMAKTDSMEIKNRNGISYTISQIKWNIWNLISDLLQRTLVREDSGL